MSEKHPFIYEPTTTLTDFLIFILGVVFGLNTFPDGDSLFHWIWACAFLSVGMGGLLGGLTHGIGPKLSDEFNQALWGLTLFFVGFTGILLGLSGLILVIGKEFHSTLFILAILFMLTYLMNVRQNSSFSTAVKFYLPMMIIALIGFSIGAFYFEKTGALFIVIGLLVSVAASVVQVMNISFHKHFNHNDLFHVIQMLGMYLMYRGGLELPVY